MMGFAGFPRETVAFLAGLEANNDKAWFEAHRGDYEQVFLAPALALIDALAPVAAALDPPHKAQAKMNGSLRRLNRDVRFSKDKRPYNARMHLIFWTGDHPNRSAGIHLVLMPTGFGYGAGHWAFDGPALERYRAAVADAGARAALQDALAAARAVGCELGEPELKKPPRGYAGDEAAGDLLRRKGLVARTHEETGLPEALFGPRAADHCAELMTALAPLDGWIARHVQA